jgi:hypothetical protein
MDSEFSELAKIAKLVKKSIFANIFCIIILGKRKMLSLAHKIP